MPIKRREQRRFKAGVGAAPSEADETQSTTKDIIYFGLRDTDVPLPLGWMLSDAAARTMQSQLRMEDNVVHNGMSMDEMSRILQPATH